MKFFFLIHTLSVIFLQLLTPQADDDDCSASTKCCQAWGDPHVTTLDDLIHHPQGQGIYDYVAPCDDTSSLLYTISAKQEKCNEDRTCVSEVYVSYSWDDETVLVFPSEGDPYQLKNGDRVRTYTSSSTNTFSSPSNTVTISHRNFEGSWTDDAGQSQYIKLYYRGTYLKIETSDCLQNQLCGLCGYFDGDASNDFYYFDSDTSAYVTISSEDVETFPMPDEAWTNTNTFADGWCNDELMSTVDSSTCEDVLPTVVAQPSTDCLDTAEDYCDQFWKDECSCEEYAIDYDSWLDSCKFDTCADSNDELPDYTYEEAVAAGFLDSILDTCTFQCVDPTGAPTENPTPYPTPYPTPNPTPNPVEVEVATYDCELYLYSGSDWDGTEWGPFETDNSDTVSAVSGSGTGDFTNDGVNSIKVIANGDRDCAVTLWSGDCDDSNYDYDVYQVDAGSMAYINADVSPDYRFDEPSTSYVGAWSSSGSQISCITFSSVSSTGGSDGVTSDAPTEEISNQPTVEPTEEPTEAPTPINNDPIEVTSYVCEDGDYYLVITDVSDSNYDWAIGTYDIYTADGQSLQNGDSAETVTIGIDTDIDADGNYVLQNVDLLASDPDTTYGALISTTTLGSENDIIMIAGTTEWDQTEDETPVEVDVSVVDCATNEAVVMCEADCITVSEAAISNSIFEMTFGFTADMIEGEYCFDDDSGYYTRSSDDIDDFEGTVILGLIDDQFSIKFAYTSGDVVTVYVVEPWDTLLYGEDIACQDTIDAFFTSEEVDDNGWEIKDDAEGLSASVAVGSVEFSDCIGVDFDCESGVVSKFMLNTVSFYVMIGIVTFATLFIN